MRWSPVRRSALVLSIVVSSITSAALADVPGGSRPLPEPKGLPAATVRAALADPGTVIRRDGPATVERVALRTADDRPIFRVTIDGDFPPRALRYTLVADGRPVAFAIPASGLRSIRAVTANPAVLTGSLGVGYGGSASVPSAASFPTTGATAGTRALTAAGSARSGPAAPGAFEVTRVEYDLGDRVYQPPGLGGKVELTADVHHPTDLTAGPYPLVLFLHGNHSSCFRGNRSDYRWPCKAGWEPIPNHEGYDYIGSRLASYGYIVVSISGNGVNVLGNYVEDTGMRQRGLLVEKHIDLWRDWSTVGGDPFGTTFVGAVDLSLIGTMGHSRGGEGVVWNVIVDRERAAPYGIDAVLPLAPVDFTRVTVNEVPLAVMLPYCDGDVYDLQGIHFFDDARYLVPGDPTPKHAVTVFGANHNFFNKVWSPSGGYPGAFDDGWPCPGKLTERQERRVGRAYIVSFFRRYLGNDLTLDPTWTGESAPASIAPARTLVSYLAPDEPNRRLDVDRFTEPADLGVNEQGGAVVPEDIGFYGWCADTFDVPCFTDRYAYEDRHLEGLSQGILSWGGGTGSVRFELPGGNDVSAFDAFQLRTAMDPAQSYGVDYQDFVLVLEDGTGARAEVGASDVGNEALANPFPRRRGFGHILLQQLRFPLELFAGVDLSQIEAVEIRFSRVPYGTIHVTDLAFSAGET
jgi:hypothetical protein